jgi:hypothetical protein
MNTKIIAGLSTVAAALAVASPALAQDAPDPGQPPIISPAQPVAPGGSSTISPAQPVAPGGSSTISPAQPVAPGGGTIVPPAQPNAPTNVQPGISVHVNDCVARTSAHGYAYAVCPVVAENVPYYRTIHLSFRSSMKTFKPRTAGSWTAQTGTLKLSSGGSLAGDTTTVTGNLKFAFPKAGVATVDRDLKVTIAPRSSGVFVSQGTAVVATS